MPFTKFTNLDFDQIKQSIKDYLRANSDFTDFDFEGSNFSVLIDTLAYNTYITAFNSNMVVNESFLDSATLRENVVSLARNIGYVPRSRSAAKATISFIVQTTRDTPTLTLSAGLVCVGKTSNTSFVFSIPESITTTVEDGIATFSEIEIYQGTFLKNEFIVDGSLDQKFILDNSFIDTSTLVVRVKGIDDAGVGEQYTKVDNILRINSNSYTYLVQEIQDERYELVFGDGVFGKRLENNAIVTASYIVTDGREGNGPSQFSFAGSLVGSANEPIIPENVITINTIQSAINGGDIEPLDSIKYFAPRLYSSQYRAVTSKDYEAIVQDIYPNTEAVLVIGGEELDPPQFGNVFISIKPQNGDYLSDFDKSQILSKLKNYSLSGINQQLLDLKILYVEADIFAYYDNTKVSDVNNLKTRISNTLTTFSKSINLNRFGGRFKYSKLGQVIDNVDTAITSNITRITIRRNLKAAINEFAQYELCYGNQFHIDPAGFNIRSTGFYIFGESNVVYLTDVPNKDSFGNLDGSGKGIISVIRFLEDDQNTGIIVAENAGTVDYITGEIMLTTIRITDTVKENNIIEIEAFPESNDVIGLKDLYVVFEVSKSTINMVKDTISSGEKISGVGFEVTSSYVPDKLTRE
jgi:hypothetical protein